MRANTIREAGIAVSVYIFEIGNIFNFMVAGSDRSDIFHKSKMLRSDKFSSGFNNWWTCNKSAGGQTASTTVAMPIPPPPQRI
jgi:hypothetical protein